MESNDFLSKKEQMNKDFCSLSYEIFNNTEYGRQLMKIFKNILMQPSFSQEESEAVGRMREGYKEFIRSILKAIEVHEEIRSKK